MDVNDDKYLDKVYNKLLSVVDKLLNNVVTIREAGLPINIKTIKLLNLYIKYLESIKQSKYTYFTVNGLSDVFNNLNKL